MCLIYIKLFTWFTKFQIWMNFIDFPKSPRGKKLRGSVTNVTWNKLWVFEPSTDMWWSRIYNTPTKYFFLAFRSDSQTLVDSQKLVAPQQFCRNLSFLFMSQLWAWWKLVKINDYFEAFSIVFNHANACARMHLLVEIHNTYYLPFPAILYLPVK